MAGAPWSSIGFWASFRQKRSYPRYPQPLSSCFSYLVRVKVWVWVRARARVRVRVRVRVGVRVGVRGHPNPIPNVLLVQHAQLGLLRRQLLVEGLRDHAQL